MLELLWLLVQGPTVDPAWLAADSAKRTVTFNLIAGHGTVNSGLNFNGFKAGGLTLTVPVGWTVVVKFVNTDPNLPHSATVIPDVKTPPLGAVAPAFPQGFTRALAEGMPDGERDEFTFVAGKAGAYQFFCAVPGHGAGGMWIRLHVVERGTPQLKAT